MGKWKLVSKASINNPQRWDKIENLDQNRWELFDMELDRTELNDLSQKYPDKVSAMSVMWTNWAKKTGAIPRPNK